MTDEERKQRICKNCDHFRDPQTGQYGQCRAHPFYPVPAGKYVLARMDTAQVRGLVRRVESSARHGAMTMELTSLYLAMRPKGLRLASRLVGPDDAEDVYQDAALQALTGEAWRGDASQETWFYAILLNAGRTTLRRRAARPEGHAVEISPELPSPHDAETAQDIRTLLRAVEGLPSLYREEVKLRLEGHGAGRDGSARKTRYFRAQGMLRKKLKVRT